MKRVHVVELEDLAWFPSTIRTCMTNVLNVFVRKLGTIPVLASLVSRAVTTHALERVVDLGSGGGGAMPEVVDLVRADSATSHVTLVMTDKFPNRDAVDSFNDPARPYVTYKRESVDATDLRTAPDGLKTMINCFHHMRPAQARAILESAARNRQPILIYELADNAIPFWLWLLFLPVGLALVFVMALGLTFMVRPLTVRQLFFTFIIPIVPLFYAWDGQASLPRIYSLSDLDELLATAQADGYTWEKGPALTERGKKRGIYLLGQPMM